MKVLFATYPMAFHTPGGGEVQLLAYERHLPSIGVDVTLFDPWQPRFDEHDCVHFFSCVGGSVHFCNFIKNIQKPLVITSSLWITDDTKHLYPLDEIRAQLLLADRIVTNSEMESTTLSDVLKIPFSKFSSVYNGVDGVFLEQPSPAIFRTHFNIRSNFVLNVGNIEPRKNQLQLVRAMHAFPDRHLICIGHVRDRSYFEQVEREAPEGRFHYLGPLDHHSDLLRSAYQACDVFCLPSTLETPGLAALEAAAQGCKLAITAIGSTREYFGDTATYLMPNDVRSIEAAVAGAMNSSLIERAARAREVFDRFAWPVVVEKLKSVYDDVC